MKESESSAALVGPCVLPLSEAAAAACFGSVAVGFHCVITGKPTTIVGRSPFWNWDHLDHMWDCRNSRWRFVASEFREHVGVSVGKTDKAGSVRIA